MRRARNGPPFIFWAMFNLTLDANQNHRMTRKKLMNNPQITSPSRSDVSRMKRFCISLSVSTRGSRSNFQEYQVALVSGTWSENFQPRDCSLKGIGKAQRKKVCDLFAELATCDDRPTIHPRARLCGATKRNLSPKTPSLPILGRVQIMARPIVREVVEISL